MNMHAYTEEIRRTYAGSENPREKLTLSALGLTGEAGEVADHVKKAFFHGHDLDREHLAKELGDILWYVGLACDAIGLSLQEIMHLNVEKLHTRYPNGFEVERSRHREQDEQRS